MNYTFMFLAGAVLMLWLVGMSQNVPVISATVTLGGVPYHSPPRHTDRPAQPACLRWHPVVPGENQWAIARLYAGNVDKNLWLRQMRYASGLAVTDHQIHANQMLCVAW